MHQEASLTDAIGKALLGFEPGQTEMDFGTLCTRSVTALESVSEPVEAVDRRWCTINKFLYNKCLASGISA